MEDNKIADITLTRKLPENATEEQKKFEEKWLYRTVVPMDGFLPKKPYVVTAALRKFNDAGETLVALIAWDYSPENKEWFTFELDEKTFERFEHDIGFVESNPHTVRFGEIVKGYVEKIYSVSKVDGKIDTK